jgi:hypothetical protein
MRNDEEPPEPDPGWHQVASSWILAGAILACVVAWAGLQYVVQFAESIPMRQTAPAPAVVPPGTEGLRPSDSLLARCLPREEQVSGEDGFASANGPSTDDAQRPVVPEVRYCESSFSGWVGLPGEAIAVEWEALR